MVSKLSILKTYYHLPLEDQFSFTYEDEHYYLTNKPFPLYYQKYISLLQINPFKIINNIYQQKNSQGYILYQVQSIPLDIQKIMSLSLIPQETKTIKEIKKEFEKLKIDMSREQEEDLDIIEEKISNKQMSSKYLFEGKLSYKSEIARRVNCNTIIIDGILKDANVEDGADVTNIIREATKGKSKGKSKKAKFFYYHGKRLNILGISRESGFNRCTVGKLLKDCELESVVDDVIDCNIRRMDIKSYKYSYIPFLAYHSNYNL